MVVLSLIIPTYNERKNITPLIARATFVLKKFTDSFEIIVVDDDSPDGTWRVAQDLTKENHHLRVIRRIDEKGLATAVVSGWREAKGEILGVMDGDLQHPPENLLDLVNLIIHTDADVVVASRHVGKGGVSDWSLIRRFLSWTGALLATLMLPGILRTVRDPMSGYFLIRRAVIDSVNLKPKGYKILLEVLARGKYKTVVEVPYIFEERKEGGSKLGSRQYLEFLIHLSKLGKETGQIGRFLRFCTVGFSGVFVNEGTLKFFTEVIGLYYIYSSVLAVEIAIVSNFIFNEFWTFRDRSSLQSAMVDRLIRLFKFNIICAIGGVLNVAILWGLTDLAGFYYLISNLVGIGVSTLWNYGINSNITWEVPVKHIEHELGKAEIKEELDIRDRLSAEHKK